MRDMAYWFPKPIPNAFLNRRKAAAYLKVSEAFISQHLVRDHSLPVTRVGHEAWWSRLDLDRWAENHAALLNPKCELTCEADGQLTFLPNDDVPSLKRLEAEQVLLTRRLAALSQSLQSLRAKRECHA